MRKIISGTALVLTATLLTGCGGDDGPSTADKSANTNMKSKPDSGSGEAKMALVFPIPALSLQRHPSTILVLLPTGQGAIRAQTDEGGR